jgi:hypothetical protein
MAVNQNKNTVLKDHVLKLGSGIADVLVSLMNKVDVLEEKNKALEKFIEKKYGVRFGIVVSNPHNEATRSSSPNAIKNDDTDNKTGGAKILFFPETQTDVFKGEEGKDQEVKNESFYQFKLTDETHAFVWVVNSEYVLKRFCNSPDAYHLVCDRKGKYFTSSSRVETTEPGEAKRDDQNWRIIKKVKISFH